MLNQLIINNKIKLKLLNISQTSINRLRFLAVLVNPLADVLLSIKCFNYTMLKTAPVGRTPTAKINLCTVDSCRFKKKMRECPFLTK